MDELEPYTGYDDYDPGLSDSAIPNEYESPGMPSVPADKLEQIPPVVTAHICDPKRHSELDLQSDGFTLPEKYARYRAGYGEVPRIAVFPDSRRVSIHPLVIVEKPPGFAESAWSRLDNDGLFLREYDATAVGEVRSPYASEEEGGVIPQTASSGGGGDSGITSGDEEEEKHDSTEMPFLDHLEEFRWALLKSIFSIVIAMLASWFLSDRFYGTITRLAANAELPLISTKLMEPIMLKLQMALVMGILLALPFVFYFLWSFVSPGLYRKEKKWILPLVFAATICFFIGAVIAYFIIIPFILPFIKSFMPTGIDQMITIGDFVSKILRFTLLFGIVFEMPLLAYILARIGILKHTWMSKYRKYAIVLIFLVGAVLTPPDPISQVLMAVPLILLYEVSIQVARFGGRKTLL